MKYPKLLLIFLGLAGCATAQNKPFFKEVVTNFFKSYSFESDESYLKFQKKKEGWYVVEDYYKDPGKYFNKQLFWSEKNKAYINLNYQNASNDTTSVSDRFLKYTTIIDWSYEESQFAKHKYYGYPGWDWDIINEPLVPALMTDISWESIARANSNFASGFIAEQFGDLFINDDTDRLPLKPQETVSASRAKKFIFYETKAIEAYQVILKHNPAYETKVGKIQIKYANEYMFIFLDLLMAGDSVAAKRFALKANYPDSLIKLSKIYLTSLPLNSILITGGDNDTYPLLYLQYVKNYRKDIIVLNYNLLGLRQYLLFVDKKYNKRLFSTADTNYLKNNFDYFLYSNENGNDRGIGVDEFIENLTKIINPYDTSVTIYKDGELRKYYSKQLFISRKNLKFSKKSKTIALDRYLLLNDFIILDMLNTVIRNRKIYFTFSSNFLSELLKFKEPLYEVNAFSD